MESRIKSYKSLSKQWCEELMTTIQRNISEELKKEKDLLGIVDIKSDTNLNSKTNSRSSSSTKVITNELPNNEFNLKKSSNTEMKNRADSSLLINNSELNKLLTKESLHQTRHKSTQTEISSSYINEGHKQGTSPSTASKI